MLALQRQLADKDAQLEELQHSIQASQVRGGTETHTCMLKFNLKRVAHLADKIGTTGGAAARIDTIFGVRWV